MLGSDWRFGHGNSLGPGECPMSLEMQGLLPLIGWLDTCLFEHIPNKANDDTQVQKSLGLRSIIDCSRHDVSGEGG